MSEKNTSIFSQKNFRRFGSITVVVILTLILIGGIVRTTGAGMGCPDWPKCFGQWVPPTDVSQLPSNYQAIYADRGYDSMEFNATKTWIEYLNRLFGALTGLFVLITFALSFAYRKKDLLIPVLSGLTLVLILIQAWLGAKVVSSLLSEYMITIHLVMAIVIIKLLIFTVVRAYYLKNGKNYPLERNDMLMPLVGVVVLTLAQLILGTLVRAEIKVIAESGNIARSEWTELATQYLPMHKLAALVVITANLYLVYQLFQGKKNYPVLKWVGVGILLSLLLQSVSGWLLDNVGFPGYAQAAHLLFAALMLCLQFGLLSWVALEKYQKSEKSKLNLQYS